MHTNFSNPQNQIMLCGYVNTTSQIQVAKIQENPQFEKIIFPYEKLLFDAPEGSELKIFIETAGKTSLFASIPCQKLQTRAPIKFHC
ncbi:DUF1830 domain-containing protein [Myxosarcina sp. GI1(2024)]